MSPYSYGEAREYQWYQSGLLGFTHIPLCPHYIKASLCFLDYQGQYPCQYKDFSLLLLIFGHEFKAHWWQPQIIVQWDACCVPYREWVPLGDQDLQPGRVQSCRDRKLKIPSGSLGVMASRATHCSFYPLVSKLLYLSYWRQYHAGVSDLINILHPKGYTPFFSEGFL